MVVLGVIPMLLKKMVVPLGLVLLTACGGGGGGSSSTLSVTGTVAVGAPLVKAVVTFIDSNGKTVTASAGDDGKFTASDISSLIAPILIKAVGTVGGEEVTLFSTITTTSATGTSTIANVTPLTNAIVSQVSAGEPEWVFNSPSSISSTITSSNISISSAKVVKLIEDPLSSLGVTSLDPFKTAFTADNTGIDKLLDLIKIDPDSFGKIQFSDKTTGKITVVASTDSIDAVTSKKLSNVPTSVQNIELPKIKTLIASFNTALSKGSSLATSDITPLLADGFLHKGEDANAFALNLKNEPPPTGYKISSAYVINSCDPVAKVCDGTGTILDTEGKPASEFKMPVKWVSGQWYFYGDQLSLDLDFQPVINIILPANTKTLEAAGSSAVKFGFWLDQTKIDTQVGRSSYDSIKIYFSNDEGTTFYPTWTLVSRSDCSYFPEINDANSGGCNNFLNKNYVPQASQSNFLAAKTSFFD